MRSIRSLAAAAFSAALLVLTAPATYAAESPQPWSWPERAKNLKVLAKKTSGDELRSAMMGFTRGLGVRCVYCHVGEEGQPLSAFDFASDKNPKKEIARGMLRMVASVNKQIRGFVPASTERVDVMCQTCHRGRPVPMSLAQELIRAYAQAGADSAIAHYRTLRGAFLESGAYDFREPSLSEVGHAALDRRDAHGAIAIFRADVEQFPSSGRAHEGLADAYLAAGDTAQAVASYEKSVELEPRNPHPAQMLKTLRPER
jgi:tetratricopeptide (TPR) repeat protein